MAVAATVSQLVLLNRSVQRMRRPIWSQPHFPRDTEPDVDALAIMRQGVIGSFKASHASK